MVEEDVFLDDHKIAEVRPEHYFIVLVDPRVHTFNLSEKKRGGVRADFRAGESYYIRVSWDRFKRPTGIDLVPEETGSFEIPEFRPVSEKNIYDPKYAFTRLPF